MSDLIVMCVIWYIAAAVELFWIAVSYAEYLDRELRMHPTLFGRRVSFCTFKLVVFAEAIIWPVWLLAHAVYYVYLTCIEEEK